MKKIAMFFLIFATSFFLINTTLNHNVRASDLYDLNYVEDYAITPQTKEFTKFKSYNFTQSEFAEPTTYALRFSPKAFITINNIHYNLWGLQYYQYSKDYDADCSAIVMYSEGNFDTILLTSRIESVSCSFCFSEYTFCYVPSQSTMYQLFTALDLNGLGPIDVKNLSGWFSFYNNITLPTSTFTISCNYTLITSYSTDTESYNVGTSITISSGIITYHLVNLNGSIDKIVYNNNKWVDSNFSIILFENYSVLPLTDYNRMISLGTRALIPKKSNSSATDLLFSIVDIPFYYISKFLNISLFGTTLFIIVCTIITIGLVIWVVKKLVIK